MFFYFCVFFVLEFLLSFFYLNRFNRFEVGAGRGAEGERDVAMMLVSGGFFVLLLPPVILVTHCDGNLAEARLPFSRIPPPCVVVVVVVVVACLSPPSSSRAIIVVVVEERIVCRRCRHRRRPSPPSSSSRDNRRRRRRGAHRNCFPARRRRRRWRPVDVVVISAVHDLIDVDGRQPMSLPGDTFEKECVL